MTTTDVPSCGWTADQLRRRLVRYGELIPCRNAFIDTRNPGSEEKENFTIIGPGVSESADQFVHIPEPHGFNIGAARQPPRCVNSQHSHETAEVFVVHSGQWTFNFGEQGEVKLPAGPGAVASVPTRLFRGFTNVGEDEGFLWVALGGDDPGHVLWAPHVFDMANDFGLVLLRDGTLVDTAAGQEIPAGAEVMPRTSVEQVRALGRPDLATIERCIVTPDQIPRQPKGPLGALGIDEHLLIGPGAQLSWPHGFTLSRVAMPAESLAPAYRHDAKEVWFVHQGSLTAITGAGELRLATGDTFSVPEGLARAWRSEEDMIAFVVRSGDKLPDLTLV